VLRQALKALLPWGDEHSRTPRALRLDGVGERRLARAAAHPRRARQELEAAHGLGLSSYEVLLRLEGNAGRRMRMCELAEAAVLSRSGLTRLVDRLERDGFVARDSCEDDACGSFAVLTEAGAKTVRDARATYIEGVRRHFLARFSSVELDGLRAFWDRLADEASERSR
jgi:DNA-binding MarR family transcriptional regulator